MRKMVLGFAMSFDGYIARPDGAVDFLVMDKDFPQREFRLIENKSRSKQSVTLSYSRIRL